MSDHDAETGSLSGLTDNEMSVIPWGLVPSSEAELPGFALGLEIGILHERLQVASVSEMDLTTHVRNHSAIHMLASRLGWTVETRSLRPGITEWERSTFRRQLRAAA